MEQAVSGEREKKLATAHIAWIANQEEKNFIAEVLLQSMQKFPCKINQTVNEPSSS